MAPVQCLLYELAASLHLTCKRNTLLVQIMITGAFGAMHAKLDQQAADFSRRKAGADDRAMHGVMHVPDCRAPARSRRHERLARRFAGPARLHRNHAARDCGRSRLEAVREDVGQQIRSAGRHAARYIPSDIANVTHNCGSGKRKERAIPVAPGASEKTLPYLPAAFVTTAWQICARSRQAGSGQLLPVPPQAYRTSTRQLRPPASERSCYRRPARY